MSRKEPNPAPSPQQRPAPPPPPPPAHSDMAPDVIQLARALLASDEGESNINHRDWQQLAEMMIAYGPSLLDAVEERDRLRVMLPEADFVTCVYCFHKVRKDDPKCGELMADHILTCEKSPLVQCVQKMKSNVEELADQYVAAQERIAELEAWGNKAVARADRETDKRKELEGREAAYVEGAAVLARRIAELEGQHDLMRDEFMRIKSLDGSSSELIALCHRAISEIEQRVPLIEQRDRACATVRRYSARIAELEGALSMLLAPSASFAPGDKAIGIVVAESVYNAAKQALKGASI